MHCVTVRLSSLVFHLLPADVVSRDLLPDPITYCLKQLCDIAGAHLPQQQPVLLAQGQAVQPGQQVVGQNQMAAPQNLVPVQYSMPTQAMLPAQGVAAQAVPVLVPSQQYQLSPSQGESVRLSLCI